MCERQQVRQLRGGDGPFGNAGLSGNATAGSPTLRPGPVVTPGIVRVMGNLGMAPGAMYQTQLRPEWDQSDPLFDAHYALPAGSIAAGLGELAPSLYPNVMITTRNSWYLTDGAIGSAPWPGGRLKRRQRTRAERQHDLGQRPQRP